MRGMLKSSVNAQVGQLAQVEQQQRLAQYERLEFTTRVLYWVVCDTATTPPLVVVVSLLRDQKLVLRKTEIIILILGT
jgi:hypothetical protein